MSLIGGLLAGAAQGVSDSWTNRRLELKEEAANAFKQATIDQQQAQFEQKMNFEENENQLNREATTNRNQAAENSKALATYYKQIDGIDKLKAQDKLPQDEYDKLERKYGQQLSAVGIPIPQNPGAAPIELPIDGGGNLILTKEQTEAERVKQLTKDYNAGALKAITTGDVNQQFTQGILNTAETIGGGISAIGSGIANAGRYVAKGSAGMERADLITRWDNGQKTIQTAKAIIEQNKIDSTGVSEEDLELAKKIVTLASQ